MRHAPCATNYPPAVPACLPQAFAPLITLNSYIQQQPNVTILGPQFQSIASGLLAQLPPNTFQALQYSPFGVVDVSGVEIGRAIRGEIRGNRCGGRGREGADCRQGLSHPDDSL